MINIKNFLNNTCLQLTKKLIFKIFNYPIFFSLSLLFWILVISFVFCHPYYQTCDDLTMRSIVDGSFGGIGKPHSFVLWQSIYYTKILQKLYIKFPQIYWYDLFTYLFMSISLIITTLCLYTNEGKNKNLLNLFLYIINFFLYLIVFINPQFSITAGCLALAGFTLYYYIFTNKLSIYKNLSLILLMFLLFIQASFVRYEVLCVMLPLGIFASILLLKKKFFKKYICLTLVLSLTFVCSYCLEITYFNIIKNNPEYSFVANNRKAYYKITEGTNIFQDTKVYSSLLSKINNIPNVDEKLKSVGWNNGTYMVLLSWFALGDENLFNVEKFQQIKQLLNNDFSIKNHINFSFNVVDYSNILKYYFLMILLLTLAIPSKNGTKKVLIFCILYFVFILLANNKFKPFPPRVWINLLNLIILSSFLILKNNYNNLSILEKGKKIIEKYNRNNISDYIIKNLDKLYVILIAILLAGYSLTPVNKIINNNVDRYEAYKNNLIVLKSLDKDKIYLTDIFVKDLYSAPFNNDLFTQNLNIITIPHLFFPETKEFLQKHNIPVKKDTIKTICERKDIYYFTHTGMPYDNFFARNNMMALYIFMKETYGQEIVFVPIKTYFYNAINLYDIVLLSPQEIKLKESYSKIMQSIYLDKLIQMELSK